MARVRRRIQETTDDHAQHVVSGCLGVGPNVTVGLDRPATPAVCNPLIAAIVIAGSLSDS
jgi:hypothetical protein